MLLNEQAPEISKLPKNSDALRVLRQDLKHQPILEKHKKVLGCGEICVTLWNETGRKTWYISYSIEVVSEKLF